MPINKTINKTMHSIFALLGWFSTCPTDPDDIYSAFSYLKAPSLAMVGESTALALALQGLGTSEKAQEIINTGHSCGGGGGGGGGGGHTFLVSYPSIRMGGRV